MEQTNEELQLRIRELEKENAKLHSQIKKARYGLVWLDVPEGFERESENQIPVLEEVKDKAIKNDDGKPTHIIIEGDNYHALTCLNYTHKGKIDVIYIDPPYNTGEDNFAYRDKRVLKEYPDGTLVPKDHPLRHSYWLSFMSKRLNLAKNLLKEDGAIFISINEVYGYGGYISYLLILGSFIASFFKISKDKRFITGVFTADTLLLIYLFTCSFGHTGYIQTTLCLYLIPLFFLTEKRDMRLFWTLMVSGMVLSLVYSYSSNGYLYVLSMGHFITCIGCIVAADRFMEETRTLSRIYPVILTIVICLSLIQTMTLRIVNIYRDAPVEMLTSRITEGPAKGLWTTSEHKEAYDRVYSTLMNECQSADLNSTGSGDGRGNIFITRILPWGYMCTDLRCASPTTWRTPFNSERLEPYYEMNPDRYPDMILVLDKEYGSFLTCGDVEADPCPNENETGGFLRDYIDANDFEILNVECGTLYKRR